MVDYARRGSSLREHHLLTRSNSTVQRQQTERSETGRGEVGVDLCRIIWRRALVRERRFQLCRFAYRPRIVVGLCPHRVTNQETRLVPSVEEQSAHSDHIQ